MDQLLRTGVAAGSGAQDVQVVRADDVATLRRSSPDTAIVALVRSTSATETIAAHLAGADVVLPCGGDDAPDPADLAAACAAARLLAGRARAVRDQTRDAAHEFAGNASAVALAAQLLGPGEPAQRAAQLRAIAAAGARLAWLAGRSDRSRGLSVEAVDLAAVVRDRVVRDSRDVIRETARTADEAGGATRQAGGATRTGSLDLRLETDGEVPALVDRRRLGWAVRHLVDNACRAGASEATIRVVAEPATAPPQDLPDSSAAAGTPGWATVTVVDDGSGLPDGWTSDDALAPFASGWSPPGDGLGLAEVAEFAADHGGSLHLEPGANGRGVRAALRFPTGYHLGDAAPVNAVTDPDWALAGILEGVARRDPLGVSLEALVATMEQHLPGSICSILLLDQDTKTLRHGAGARLPRPYREAIDGLAIGPLAGSCGTAAYTRQEVVVSDIATDERWARYRDYALPYHLRSCWSRPIIDTDRGLVLGTFAVYHGDRWVPDPSAAELVQRLTHVAAVAIGTADLHGQLVESEARFRSTFEAAGLGIALVSPSGTIQDANAALNSMAGRPLVGQPLAGLLVDEDAVATLDALASLLARPGLGGNLIPAEVRVRRPDRPGREPVWAAMSGSLIRGPAGDPRHFCLELFDLTERRRVAQARHAREVAEAADRAKSELLAQVSHEVRTPLHAVIGFAQALQAMPLSPERQRESIEHILGAGRHLLQLINDLLDLTGAETGQLPLVPESVAADEVVAEALQIVAGLAAERSLALRTHGAPDHRVWADRHRLRQVLLNLLGNAIKFTPAGGAVDVRVRPGEILVQDTGEGIPAEYLPFLFTPFHRGSATGPAGSGLGLALSQRLMRAMDGDLTLVSSSPTGTRFRLVLPAAPPDRGKVTRPVPAG